jgi:hypothetical protein
MTCAAKSNFSRLVSYNTDSQGKDERIGTITITNCHSDQVHFAVLEVLNTQAQNTRSRADKTFHLLVSFPPDEMPDAATLIAIEARLCASIGFADHQRISVVHHDTDSVHIHIAINKIHPRRYTIHEPYNAYHTLGNICDSLEVEYGLQHVNHIANKSGGENRAADMERHAAVESLLGWIKRECTEQMQGAQSWTEMHKLMREHGLTINERGNGLVITAQNGVGVKASSVSREFSKSKLEQRLGDFQKHIASSTENAPSKQYACKPMMSRVDTAQLYARYKLAQTEVESTRATEWVSAMARKNRLIENAKRRGQLKRAAIKLVQAPAIGKKLMYKATSTALRNDIGAINTQCRKQRQEIHGKFRRLAWADWLRSQAIAGDKEALAALRAREISTSLSGNTVGGRLRPIRPTAVEHRCDNITKRGTIIYRIGASAVRDDGSSFKVSRGTDQVGLHAALRMAMNRYGSCLAVNGTAEFKEQVAQAAAAALLSVSFDDVALESRRQQLAQSRGSTERKFESESGLNSDIIKQRPDRMSPSRQRADANTSSTRSNYAPIDFEPPTEGRNRLRRQSTSEIEAALSGRTPVVDFTQSRTISVPQSVLSKLKTPALEAAQKYIIEREQKRLNGFDIPKHKAHTFSHSLEAVHAEMRLIDGQTLALLKAGDDIMVLPIDDATARRLKRLTLGRQVAVSAKGTIKTKGRRR